MGRGQRGQEGLRLSLTCSAWQNLRGVVERRIDCCLQGDETGTGETQTPELGLKTKRQKRCTKQRYKNEWVKIRLETSQNSSLKSRAVGKGDCIHLY